MPNEQLVAHIRDEFSRGVDRTVVIRSLLTAGWKVEDINTAITTVNGGGSQSVPPTPSAPSGPASPMQPAPVIPAIKYAGFWVRAAAILVDSFIVGIPYLLIILAVGFADI